MNASSTSEIVRFLLPESSCFEELQADLSLAVFTAECIHGRPKTRLGVSFLIDDDGRQCVVRVQGEAGESALHVLVGLLAERFGEDRFTVERMANGATVDG